jgi:SWI/SNF-related matrix-associated actin-dependent regulator 1 of chromatin subfamily A
VIIFDEMHSLKSPEARRTQACLDPTRGLWTRASRVWGLSGTPAPNHWGELYPWLRALHPESVEGMDQEAFIRRYLFARDTPYGLRVTGIGDREGLKAILDPVLLRRKREEVLPELPPLMVDMLPLAPTEALPEVIRELETHPEVGSVKAILQALGPDADPEDIIASAEMEASAIRRLYGLAKVPLIARQVEDELESESKIVIMGWHREVLTQLAQKLAKFNPVVVMGGTTPAGRVEAVDRFQNDPNVRLFIGNIASAGTSITLTAANRLIFAEASWVPGDNDQAMLRILRIGQDRPCRVSYASLAGSLDDVIMAVMQRKAELLAAVVE